MKKTLLFALMATIVGTAQAAAADSTLPTSNDLKDKLGTQVAGLLGKLGTQVAGLQGRFDTQSTTRVASSKDNTH